MTKTSKKRLKKNGRNGAKNGATKRVVQSWVSFPEGRLMKAIAVKLHDNGLRGKALERKFMRLVPYWRSYFSRYISDSAISQRADKGRRYPNENPEHDPHSWQMANFIVRMDKALGLRTMRQLANPPSVN